MRRQVRRDRPPDDHLALRFLIALFGLAERSVAPGFGLEVPLLRAQLGEAVLEAREDAALPFRVLRVAALLELPDPLAQERDALLDELDARARLSQAPARAPVLVQLGALGLVPSPGARRHRRGARRDTAVQRDRGPIARAVPPSHGARLAHLAGARDARAILARSAIARRRPEGVGARVVLVGPDDEADHGEHRHDRSDDESLALHGPNLSRPSFDAPPAGFFTLCCAPVAYARFLVLVALLCACGPAGRVEQPRSLTAEQRAGAELYVRYCALCHGESGEGYAADAATRLNGQSFLRTATDELLRTAIARGRIDTAMAAYSREHGGPLDDAQIDAIVAFIRTWQEGPPIDVGGVEVRGDPERGARLFTERCASCHGTLGEGASAQSLRAPSFLHTASDGFLRYAIVHGREGTPMPAFGGELEPRAIDDLVAFLRRMEREPDAVPAHLSPPSLDDVPLLRHPEGPTPTFTLREGRYVSAVQVRDAIEQRSRLIVLDARPTSDWLRRRLPGAIPVPYYDIEPIIERLPRDGTWIVAYCGCPHAASGAVVDALRAAGFENTAVLDEGVYHWIDQGYPTESGPVSAPP